MNFQQHWERLRSFMRQAEDALQRANQGLCQQDFEFGSCHYVGHQLNLAHQCIEEAETLCRQSVNGLLSTPLFDKEVSL